MFTPFFCIFVETKSKNIMEYSKGFEKKAIFKVSDLSNTWKTCTFEGKRRRVFPLFKEKTVEFYKHFNLPKKSKVSLNVHYLGDDFAENKISVVIGLKKC